MKVKKETYLRSLTALLRPRNFDTRRDPNENCDPWYATVPSVTHIWTHRPQWRRRHKNRKRGKLQRFPPTFINNPRTNKNNLWNALELNERSRSRSSTSPYETCSSRQIFTESEISRNFIERRNEQVCRLTSNKINLSFDRKGTACRTRSDSGLQNCRGKKSVRTIRSQKRLGVGNSSNIDNIVITLSNLEVNRSVQLSMYKGLESNCRITKRRVTFSNYVSSNSMTDTRSLINVITMNDNYTSDGSWWRRSNVRFTDDEDNCSMETDLSCLISSVNFDESKSSSFSLTTAESLDVENKSVIPLNVEFGKNLFYVNSAYSNNASSCNLLAISKKNFSVDDFRENYESQSKERNCLNHDDFTMQKMREEIVRLSLSNIIVPDIRMSKEIKKNTTTYDCDAIAVDFMKNKWIENWRKSNDVVPVLKIPEDIKIEATYSCIPRIADISSNEIKKNRCESNRLISGTEIPENTTINSKYSCNLRTDDFIDDKLNAKFIEKNKIVRDIEISELNKNDDTCSSTEYITIELKEISSTTDDIMPIESPEETDNKSTRHSSLPKNDISTDTNDLIVINLIPSSKPMTEFAQNNVNNESFSINNIFDFLKKPKKSLPNSYCLEEFETLAEQGIGNFDSIGKFSDVDGKKCDEDIKNIDDEVKLLRINTENCGECESILIEMKDFVDDLTNEEILDTKGCSKIGQCLRERCESHDVNLNRSNVRSNHVESSMSNFHEKYTNCSAGDKSCRICGRRTLDNPRYIRPVCRVKGGAWSPQLQNDPWIKVLKKVVKHDNRRELIPRVAIGSPESNKILTNKELSTNQSPENLVSTYESNNLNNDNNVMDEISKNIEKEESNNLISDREDKNKDECTIIVTETGTEVETDIVLSRLSDRSTSCCSSELRSSTSFGFAAFRGPRTRSAKTYFMRESVRTVGGAMANRLLCVISETDSLMAVPPFFPKKPPDWFARRMPTGRWSRR